MLTRETFVDAISKIKKNKELMERLDSVCREFGSFRPSLDFGNLHLQALLEVLKEAMDDKYDYIGWWLYEGTDHIVSWEENGQKVSVDLTEVNALPLSMNDGELIAKVRSSMYRQCRECGFAAPVDVLMEIGVLPKKGYEDWRYGRVDYLERVCTVNLKKLSAVLREMRAYARAQNLKPSFCCYKRRGVKKKDGQGRKPVILLRFSKSGAAEIERSYATHYVDEHHVAELKAERQQTDAETLPSEERV